MTAAQIFRWFCKEQKIMHKMREMYYDMHPYKVNYNSLDISKRYLTFDEYITNKVMMYGFNKLILIDFIDDYMRFFFSEKRPFTSYWGFRDKLFTYFNKPMTRLDYFGKNNVFLNENNFKIGSFLTFNGKLRVIKTSSCNISNGLFEGVIHSNGEKYDGYIRFRDINDGEKILDFFIKRKGKVYYGKN